MSKLQQIRRPEIGQVQINIKKIPQKISNNKTTFLKTGILSAIIACWGVILIGTFLTFK